MSKAVFIHKADSIYDDDPEVKYDFPKMYLSRVEKTVGDWIVYYEPRSADAGKGRLVYFATAKVQAVIPHPTLSERFYALIEPRTFLSFDRPVERMIDGMILERSLERGDGTLLSGGVANSAVRMLSDGEYAAIIDHAFTVDPIALGLDQAPETIDGFPKQFGFNEPQTSFIHAEAATERPIVQQLLNRPFRDAAFARQVKAAYGNRCAVSGLSLKNGGNRPEVEAAHIRPVEHGGPDRVQNGLALSGTIHWMFDRGLISVSDDYKILVSENKVPKDTVSRLIVPDRNLLVPKDPRNQPNQVYLAYHRENIFGR